MIQNTCPRGYAGKTSLVSKCGHCVSKITVTSSEIGMLSAAHQNHVILPMYAFVVPRVMPSFQTQRHHSSWTIRVEGYEDVMIGELLKPPRA